MTLLKGGAKNKGTNQVKNKNLTPFKILKWILKSTWLFCTILHLKILTVLLLAGVMYIYVPMIRG